MLEDLLQKRQMIYDKTLKGLKVQCRFSETIFLKKTLKTALNTFFFFFKYSAVLHVLAVKHVDYYLLLPSFF